MTNSPIDNDNSRVGTHIVALLVVLLLVGVALLNLPSPSVPPSKPSTPYVTVITAPSLLRSGPGAYWNPPLAVLKVNQQLDLLARTPDGRWFKVSYNGNS